MVHITKRKKLEYFDGNYDSYMKTKSEKDENQMKQYKWEQEQMKSMKEYIARFGHGTAKNAKQAQSKEKVLAKMIRAGLTDKPEEEKVLNFKFPNPGHVSFVYIYVIIYFAAIAKFVQVFFLVCSALTYRLTHLNFILYIFIYGVLCVFAVTTTGISIS